MRDTLSREFEGVGEQSFINYQDISTQSAIDLIDSRNRNLGVELHQSVLRDNIRNFQKGVKSRFLQRLEHGYHNNILKRVSRDKVNLVDGI